MFEWLLGKHPREAPSPVILPESVKAELDPILRKAGGRPSSAAVKLVRDKTGLSLTDAAVVVRRRAEEIL